MNRLGYVRWRLFVSNVNWWIFFDVKIKNAFVVYLRESVIVWSVTSMVWSVLLACILGRTVHKWFRTSTVGSFSKMGSVSHNATTRNVSMMVLTAWYVKENFATSFSTNIYCHEQAFHCFSSVYNKL